MLEKYGTLLQYTRKRISLRKRIKINALNLRKKTIIFKVIQIHSCCNKYKKYKFILKCIQMHINTAIKDNDVIITVP